MTLDKTQLTARQKAITVGIFLAVVFTFWQLYSYFSGGSQPTSKGASSNKVMVASGKNTMSPNPNGQSNLPQPAQVGPQLMTPTQQAELIRLQQETQQKYVIALNELQMLKLNQQIAETNKDIAAAKLATVTAQKGIIDLLTKPTAPIETAGAYTQGLAGSVPSAATTMPIANNSAVSIVTSQVVGVTSYVVISVSQLLSRWSAVVGYQGKLYSVYIGDILPPDQSTVIDIDKYGIILKKDGIVRKVSLVPII